MKKTGLILAGAAAALLASGVVLAANDNGKNHNGKVKCSGINACKGKSACKGADNSCQGQNACKGKGYKMVSTDKECIDKGGKVAK